MKVYRDVDGKPELVGECSLRLRLGDFCPQYIENDRPYTAPDRPSWMRVIRDTWMTAIIGEFTEQGTYSSEYVIKLRPEDNPEHLPGWRPSMDVYRIQDGKVVPLTIEEMADDILVFFDRYPPDMTRGRIIGYLSEVRDRTEEAFRRERPTLPCRACGKPLDHYESSAFCLRCRIDKLAKTSPMVRQAPRPLYSEPEESDHEAGLVPLPQKPQPEEKPYIPQKFGEHD